MANVKRCWKKYNKSLVKRGSITFWIDPELLKNGQALEKTKGRPKFKTSIIHAGWVLRVVYSLTFRQLEGFFSSLISMLGADFESPNYTLFCKRSKEVRELLPKLSNRRPMELVIDASGLKIYGEGEWKTHVHGRNHPRKWIKVHVAVDPKTGECISAVITDEKGGDSSQLKPLLRGVPKGTKRVYADGAYDTKKCRKLLYKLGIEDVIPPRKGSIIRGEKGLKNRDNAITEVLGLGNDLDLWKRLKGYGRRSLAETFFSRLKTILGERLSSKKIDNQELETLLRLHILNSMLKTG